MFKDRMLRDRRYKVYVDTLKSINRLYDLKSDPYEEHNLIREKNKMVSNILEKCNKTLRQIPDKDNDPDYK